MHVSQLGNHINHECDVPHDSNRRSPHALAAARKSTSGSVGNPALVLNQPTPGRAGGLGCSSTSAMRSGAE